MSRKNVALATIFLLMSIGGTFYLQRQGRLRREQQDRQEVLASALSKISDDIHIGDTRAKVDAYLKRLNTSYYQRTSPGEPLYNDLVPVGRRPSGVWFCGPIQFGVEIDFRPDLASAPERVDGSPNDTVGKIKPYEWADNCM